MSQHCVLTFHQNSRDYGWELKIWSTWELVLNFVVHWNCIPLMLTGDLIDTPALSPYQIYNPRTHRTVPFFLYRAWQNGSVILYFCSLPDDEPCSKLQCCCFFQANACFFFLAGTLGSAGKVFKGNRSEFKLETVRETQSCICQSGPDCSISILLHTLYCKCSFLCGLIVKVSTSICHTSFSKPLSS